MDDDKSTTIHDTVKIKKLDVSAYRIPTETPEADGTVAWNSTTLILTEIEAGNQRGVGYTYATRATADFIYHTLRQLVVGENALAITAITNNLIRQIRNNGNCGITAMAISAIDAALWDLK